MGTHSSAVTGTLQPLRDVVYVTNMEKGARQTAGGIILRDDNMKEHGIHARWCQVYLVGPKVDDLTPGQWVYVKHGRWTNGFEYETPEGEIITLWQVEYPDSVELVSDECPLDTVEV
jgi:hypothetical protein